VLYPPPVTPLSWGMEAVEAAVGLVAGVVLALQWFQIFGSSLPSQTLRLGKAGAVVNSKPLGTAELAPRLPISHRQVVVEGALHTLTGGYAMLRVVADVVAAAVAQQDRTGHARVQRVL
jgi:hypothetical protein